jgi:hypothetical protein
LRNLVSPLSVLGLLLFFSNVSARTYNTLSCRHVYLPSISANV